ncbi:purple acid phosphatase family protein [Streptomyces cyaneus]|uniref:purple acid phosphatase family protein n=1 Tax=Streptomyces cyaneus TaxID=1904 RepID=UPI0013E2B687|nr:metallophosphoesterase family protein [Streptomyces cyaneus]
MRRSLAAAVAALSAAFALTGTAFADLPGASPLLTRAPYLSDATSTSMRVNWGTSTQTRGTVRWGPLGNCTANTATALGLGTPISVNGTTQYQNRVLVSGLSPGTQYCYRVFTGDATPVDLLGTNPSPTFTTLEPAGGATPFSFAVMGDWGDTTNSGVNDGSLNVNQANLWSQLGNSGVRFALSAGDVAYPAGSQTSYGDLNQTGVNISAVFRREYWAYPGQHLPMFITNGNHGRNMTALTNWPETTTATASGGRYAMENYPSFFGTTPASYPSTYYAFDSGPVRFYVLDASWSDSNLGSATGGTCGSGSSCKMYQIDAAAHWSTTSAQYQWLQNDLTAHPGGLKVAVFHFPLRSDNSAQKGDTFLQNTPGNPNSLEQLLHDNGVNLVFNGHGHHYQRNVAPPGGVPSYVTGAGGAKLHSVSTCSATDAYAISWTYTSNRGKVCGGAPVPTADSQVFHFLKVSVNGTTLTVTPTNSLGNTFDEQVYNFASDSSAPTPVGGLTVGRSGSTTSVVSWTAASDNIGVAAYDVYRNGTYLATVAPNKLTFSDKTAACPATYSYEVRARDLADNTSAATASVTC